MARVLVDQLCKLSFSRHPPLLAEQPQRGVQITLALPTRSSLGSPRKTPSDIPPLIEVRRATCRCVHLGHVSARRAVAVIGR